MCDMAEIQVNEDEQVEDSHSAIHCRIDGCETSWVCNRTVPFHSIHQSRVTGLPKLTKCHDCHSHFGEVTKSFGDHVPNIEIFRCLRCQTAENFAHVTANLGGWCNAPHSVWTSHA